MQRSFKLTPRARRSSGPIQVPKAPEGRGFCLRIGRFHPTLRSSGEYRVCLTSNQLQRLFGGHLPVEFGCGTFACTYLDPRNNSRLVKITEDAEDVSGLLAAQKAWSDAGESRVPRVHDAFKLRQKGIKLGKKPRAIPVYAMVVDKLHSVPVNDRGWVTRVMHRAFYEVVDARVGAFNPKAAVDSPGVRLRVTSDCPSRAIDGIAVSDRCVRFVGELLAAVRQLEHVGVKWSDIHVGNIGMDDQGRWRVFDLGLSKHRRNVSTLEVLAGARRRVDRRLRLWRRRRA